MKSWLIKKSLMASSLGSLACVHMWFAICRAEAQDRNDLPAIKYWSTDAKVIEEKRERRNFIRGQVSDLLEGDGPNNESEEARLLVLLYEITAAHDVDSIQYLMPYLDYSLRYHAPFDRVGEIFGSFPVAGTIASLGADATGRIVNKIADLTRENQKAVVELILSKIARDTLCSPRVNSDVRGILRVWLNNAIEGENNLKRQTLLKEFMQQHVAEK